MRRAGLPVADPKGGIGVAILVNARPGRVDPQERPTGRAALRAQPEGAVAANRQLLRGEVGHRYLPANLRGHSC